MVMEMAGHGDLLEYVKRVCGCAAEFARECRS